MVTDRAVYKPGDTVHVKAYARSQQGTEMLVPTVGYTLRARWKGYSNPTADTAVRLDKATGAFHTTLTIPTDASYGPAQLSLVNDGSAKDAQDISAGTASVTIADPRPPTVVMKLRPANDELVVSKAGSVGVEVSTRTYLGSAVAGQAIEVTWSVGSTAKGAISVVTGADGTGVGDFKLPADALEFVKVGDTVAFAATWVGPTREVVKAEASIVVSESKWAIALTNSPSQPLPGYLFSTSVDVTELGTGAAQQGVDVTVGLYQREAGAGVSPTAIASANGAVEVGAQVGASCTMKAGAGAGCPLTLASTGNFVVVACVAADPDGKKICATSATLGLTAEQWAYAPLKSLSRISLAADKQSYTKGEVARFSFVNPFTDARVMAVWGNRVGRKTMVTGLLQPGAQNVSIDIGDECVERAV